MLRQKTHRRRRRDYVRCQRGRKRPSCTASALSDGRRNTVVGGVEALHAWLGTGVAASVAVSVPRPVRKAMLHLGEDSHDREQPGPSAASVPTIQVRALALT